MIISCALFINYVMSCAHLVLISCMNKMTCFCTKHIQTLLFSLLNFSPNTYSGNRQLPSDGGKSGKSGGGTHGEWEGEWEEHKSWSSSSSTKWSSESTKWSSSSSSGDWKGEVIWVENDWNSSGKSVSSLVLFLFVHC